MTVAAGLRRFRRPPYPLHDEHVTREGVDPRVSQRTSASIPAGSAAGVAPVSWTVVTHTARVASIER
jgi:hypothetical protein